ncbi:MAG: hypothetical protein IMY73_04905 [Bacteroidetes bacterium]|nr:hypothetical protein [Bacteroidota bacterium]
MKKIYLLLVLLCLVACSEDVCSHNTILKSDNDIIKVDMVENSTSISFYANDLWKITVDSSWIDLSTKSGVAGDNTVNVNIKQNDTGEKRQAKIFISSADIQRPFLIIQRGKNDFILSEESITLNSKRQTFEIEVVTNLFFDVECADSWLSYQLTRTNSKNKLQFSVDANIIKSENIGERRETKIIIKDRETSYFKEVKVVQMPYLSTPELEYVALEEFYNYTSGDGWKNNTNWLSDKPLSSWYGIKVSAEGKVIEINLKNNNLDGLLNSKLKDLVYLRKLDVSENELRGSIPRSYVEFEYWYDFDAKNKIIPQLKGNLSCDFSYPDGYVGNILKSSKQNPFEIVILGDGFIKDNLKPYGDFDKIVNDILDYIFSISPFSEYKEYFNIDIVYVHSQEEGLDMKEGLDMVNTAFNIQYCMTEDGNMLIPKDLSALDRYLLPITKTPDMCLMISNTDIYGWNVGEVVTVSKDISTMNFFIREIGHYFGLVDEFINEIKVLEKNLTIDMVKDKPNVDVTNDFSKIKWRHFIGLKGYENEGAFEGGYFFEKDVWRPQEKSIMGDLDCLYFNAISRETIVKGLMKKSGEQYDFNNFINKDKPIINDK